jgi:hypothetical protein
MSTNGHPNANDIVVLVLHVHTFNIHLQFSRDTHGHLSASAVPRCQQDKKFRELSTFQTSSIVNSALLRLTGDK